MTLADRIAAVLDRRSVLLAFCALPFAVLLIVDLISRLDWQNAERGAAPRESEPRAQAAFLVLEEQSSRTQDGDPRACGNRRLQRLGPGDRECEGCASRAGPHGRPDPGEGRQSRIPVSRAWISRAPSRTASMPSSSRAGAGVRYSAAIVGRPAESSALRIRRRSSILDAAHRRVPPASGDAEPARRLSRAMSSSRPEPIVVRGSGALAGWLAATRRLSPATADAAARCGRRRADR